MALFARNYPAPLDSQLSPYRLASAPQPRNIPQQPHAPLPSSDPFGPVDAANKDVDLLMDEEPEMDVLLEEEEEGEETLVGTQPAVLSAPPPAPETVAQPTLEAAANRPRSSIVGRALFPCEPRTIKPNVSSQGSPRSKRHSHPLTFTASSSSSSSLSSTSTSLLSKRSSLPGTSTSTTLSRSPTRKSTSPSHAAGRHALSASLPSSHSAAQREGTLLALPAAKQLHDLKARNAALNRSLAAQQAEANAQLAKATERIRQLEEEQERGKTDAEGWEAEAQRLSAELAAASASTSAAEASTSSSAAADQPAALAPAPVDPAAADLTADLTAQVVLLTRQLVQEQSKRRRAKEMQAKLRCELVNRRWKEKWEVELLEREERKWEVRIVELEAELAGVRWERACEVAEKEEAQETLAAATKRLSALSASRRLLLASFSTAESTISTLRAELAATKGDLDGALAAAREIEALQAELEERREEVTRLRKGEKSGESKGKEAEKERARREKLEGEVKELK
ncbi:hypothetical protein JCM10207_003007, partial [Rhodosporidiobolus poonsookiae]